MTNFAHLTLPTTQVARTAAFFVEAFGWTYSQAPANVPMEAQWLDIGRGQQIHVVYVPNFATSPFECEFGRHIAVFYPLQDFPALKLRLRERGAVIVPELRSVPFERIFFREPVNGYFFEVIDDARETKA